VVLVMPQALRNLPGLEADRFDPIENAPEE
jgi:hypothetical protein